MTKRIGSSRRRTRHVMSVAKKEKGKLTITKFMLKLSPGDKVVFKAAPSVHKGVYYRRFHGKTGVVMGPAGGCYRVSIKDLGLEKTVIVNPVHLAKVKNGTKNN
jgi:large subunit ribosomal protein L21e